MIFSVEWCTDNENMDVTGKTIMALSAAREVRVTQEKGHLEKILLSAMADHHNHSYRL